jgi:hypothetical protein
MSNQVVDIIGVKSIVLLINQSGLTKFIIRKYGSPIGTLPVFESLDNKTPDKAVQSFSQWSNLVLMGNPNNDTIYDLNLFNESDFTGEEDQEDLSPGKVKKIGYAKKDKIRINFQLNNNYQERQPQINGERQQSSSYTQENINEMIQGAITKHLENQEREELLDRIGSLEDMLMKIAENKVESQEVDPIDRISKIIDKVQLMSFSSKKSPGALVNGQEATATNRKELLLHSINELSKVDPKLPEHLSKLLQVATEDPKQFAQFLVILEGL